MTAARGIDQRRSRRQQRQGASVQEPLRSIRQGQQTDENLTAPEQGRQRRLTSVAGNSVEGFGAAAPDGSVETECTQLAASVLAQCSSTENSYPPVGSIFLIELAPDAGFLLGSIIQILSVQAQHLERHVFAHCV